MSFLGLFSRSQRRRQRARRRFAVTAVTLLGLGAMAVAATAYSRLYVFGESLSEVGNLLAAAGIATPPANSGTFDGTFGPGNPVWAEDLAAHLGLQANSWTSGGSNVDPGQMDGVLPEGFSLPSIAAQIAAAGAPAAGDLVVIQGANAGVFAGGFGGATVIAGNAGNFSGAAITPLSFDNAPVVFGLRPGQAFVPNPNPSDPDPSCAPDCPPDPPFVLPCVDCEPGPLPEIVDNGNGEEITCPPGYILTHERTCVRITFTGTPPEIVSSLQRVPEPATVAVILLGMGALVLVRQRRPVWTRRARRDQP
jgi:hypothetical protein